MPMFAICSSFDCDYQVQLQDARKGTSVDKPTECPKCKSPIIALCPHCKFPLVAQLDRKYTWCVVCRQNIRKAFWALRGRAASA
jgi:primosomal protein N'